MKSYVAFGLVCLIAGCSSVESKRSPANSFEQPPVFPGEVWGADQELVAHRMPIHGNAHRKHHGCAKAQWTTANVEKAVSKNSGIFSEPGSQYDAWIRFSNGSPQGAGRDDADADVRGMAIKLMRVKKTPLGSQDFLLMTSPNFFSKDAEDYMEFHEAINAGKLKVGEYMVMHPRNARILAESRVRLNNPLEATYFGPVPSRIGDSSMRFKVVPCVPLTALAADEKNPNFLRANLAKTLNEQSACFDFYVQINRDPVSNPIEDPRKIWSEEQSPYLLAARLAIPKQSDVDSPEQLAFCENLKMDPWNSQDEIRPLGQINRIRKAVFPGVTNGRLEDTYNDKTANAPEPTHF